MKANNILHRNMLSLNAQTYLFLLLFSFMTEPVVNVQTFINSMPLNSSLFFLLINLQSLWIKNREKSSLWSFETSFKVILLVSKTGVLILLKTQSAVDCCLNKMDQVSWHELELVKDHAMLDYLDGYGTSKRNIELQ